MKCAEATRRGTGTGSERARETRRKTAGDKGGGGGGGGGISESDSLSEDRINRVHEVSEEVTWLLPRTTLSRHLSPSLAIFVPFLLLFPRVA